ncbi:MAG: DUF4249 domain-containing protein [Bacteroidia bacterium]|nr:MAG: DUF4249 domain-containing protein [Bacteroidia bacterium]
MYRASWLIWFPLLCCLLGGCIERYYPEGEEFKSGTLVVIAHIDNSGGPQSIYVSRSTSQEYPKKDPVAGCYVEIEDVEGASFPFEEDVPGEYTGIPDDRFLKEGEEYRLLLETPDGARYESDFEKLHPAPAIDALYWKKEELPTSEPEKTMEGIRFYMDFEIEKDSGRYLRWHLVETYEMHNPEYESTEVYDTDRRFKPIPPEIDWSTCWITNQVPEIFTMDLGNVEGDTYREMPLNFVSNEGQRLKYRYSLKVRQFALSPSAYWYWDGLKNNVQSNGGLFDSQPSLTPGNICNVNDENEIVIGYFSVSGISERRIFVSDVPDLRIIPVQDFCEPAGLPFSFSRLSRAFLPYYIATLEIDGVNRRGNVSLECIDCSEHNNSTHVVPDFW